MLKSFTDETITFMIAFAMIMPWTAIATAESVLSGAASLAQASGVVHVAIASDYTHPVSSLPVPQWDGTVAAQNVAGAIADMVEAIVR